MGTITVTISDDAERWLRKTAGTGKGKLGNTLTAAIQTYQGITERDEAGERLLEMLRKGLNLGGKPFKREELYDRV